MNDYYYDVVSGMLLWLDKAVGVRVRIKEFDATGRLIESRWLTTEEIGLFNQGAYCQRYFYKARRRILTIYSRCMSGEDSEPILEEIQLALSSRGIASRIN